MQFGRKRTLVLNHKRNQLSHYWFILKDVSWNDKENKQDKCMSEDYFCKHVGNFFGKDAALLNVLLVLKQTKHWSTCLKLWLNETQKELELSSNQKPNVHQGLVIMRGDPGIWRGRVGSCVSGLSGSGHV